MQLAHVRRESLSDHLHHQRVLMQVFLAGEQFARVRGSLTGRVAGANGAGKPHRVKLRAIDLHQQLRRRAKERMAGARLKQKAIAAIESLIQPMHRRLESRSPHHCATRTCAPAPLCPGCRAESGRSRSTASCATPRGPSGSLMSYMKRVLLQSQADAPAIRRARAALHAAQAGFQAGLHRAAQAHWPSASICSIGRCQLNMRQDEMRRLKCSPHVIRHKKIGESEATHQRRQCRIRRIRRQHCAVEQRARLAGNIIKAMLAV